MCNLPPSSIKRDDRLQKVMQTPGLSSFATKKDFDISSELFSPELFNNEEHQPEKESSGNYSPIKLPKPAVFNLDGKEKVQGEYGSKTPMKIKKSRIMYNLQSPRKVQLR